MEIVRTHENFLALELTMMCLSVRRFNVHFRWQFRSASWSILPKIDLDLNLAHCSNCWFYFRLIRPRRPPTALLEMHHCHSRSSESGATNEVPWLILLRDENLLETIKIERLASGWNKILNYKCFELKDPQSAVPLEAILKKLELI